MSAEMQRRKLLILENDRALRRELEDDIRKLTRPAKPKRTQLPSSRPEFLMGVA